MNTSATASTIKNTVLALPMKPWELLPTELRMRALVVSQTRGKLKKRVDTLVWQRNLRAQDAKRLQAQHRHMGTSKK